MPFPPVNDVDDDYKQTAKVTVYTSMALLFGWNVIQAIRIMSGADMETASATVKEFGHMPHMAILVDGANGDRDDRKVDSCRVQLQDFEAKKGHGCTPEQMCVVDPKWPNLAHFDLSCISPHSTATGDGQGALLIVNTSAAHDRNFAIRVESKDWASDTATNRQGASYLQQLAQPSLSQVRREEINTLCFELKKALVPTKATAWFFKGDQKPVYSFLWHGAYRLPQGEDTRPILESTEFGVEVKVFNAFVESTWEIGKMKRMLEVIGRQGALTTAIGAIFVVLFVRENPKSKEEKEASKLVIRWAQPKEARASGITPSASTIRDFGNRICPCPCPCPQRSQEEPLLQGRRSVGLGVA